ncbi:superoxide dismutase family protein [Pseudanabaena galeata UHCC 0370]|uniref:Superoxide dismutase family protein n=1 Tax=Pseudanabaena galeata UHCC 0370 TaxID=3110310 RepID=A0ABU5TE53_9CYAN|nr:superoxide dismutase family protein [Pseudanabaena galeata]MEA5476545.1 superoxide dismutase family protein [Pseudanabaena galeata UHCC 0370]
MIHLNKYQFQAKFASKFVVFLPLITMATLTSPAISKTLKPSANSQIFNAKGELVGTATFTQSASGVKVTLQVQKLAQGEHMVHLHENGKCEAPDFKSAGHHFDPKRSPVDDSHDHGLHHMHNKHHHHIHDKHEDMKHGSDQHKPAGDLPNIMVKQDGSGTLTATLPELTLGTGRNSLLKQGGTAIIIHAGANGKSTIPNVDYKTRIACGVVKPQ